MMGSASLLLTLTACDGIGLQSDSQAITSGVATTASVSTAASVSKAASVTTTAGISNRSGAQQQRDCLHCAP
jgi:hypothetical protein